MSIDFGTAFGELLKTLFSTGFGSLATLITTFSAEQPAQV